MGLEFPSLVGSFAHTVDLGSDKPSVVRLLAMLVVAVSPAAAGLIDPFVQVSFAQNGNFTGGNNSLGSVSDPLLARGSVQNAAPNSSSNSLSATASQGLLTV